MVSLGGGFKSDDLETEKNEEEKAKKTKEDKGEGLCQAPRQDLVKELDLKTYSPE